MISAEPASDKRRSTLIDRLRRMRQELRGLPTLDSIDAASCLSDVSSLLAETEEQLRADEAAAQRTGSEQAAILDAIPSHLALLDETGRIVAVNEAWRRFARSNGFSGERFAVGDNYIEICERARGVASKAAAEVAEGLRAVLAGQAPSFAIDYPCHDPDEECWFRMTVTPVRTPDRRGALVIHRNVTESTIAEHELNRATDLLRLAGRMAKVGGWSVDLESGKLDLSSEVCSVCEIEPGTSITLDEGFSFYAPGSRERIMAAFAACAEDGLSYDEELEIVTAKGNRRWVRILGDPVRDGEGRIIRVQGTFQDVGEQKKAEAALRLSERRFREFADALPQIVWTTDRDGDVDYVNRFAFAYAGRPVSGPPGAKWVKALHPDDVSRIVAAWAESLRTGAHFSHEYRFRAADGSYRWHLSSVAPIRDESGTIVKWYGTAVDIHDRKEAEAEARKLGVRLNATLESIEDGFFTLDREWRFTFLNAKAAALLRRPRSELLGRSMWDAFPEGKETVAFGEYRRAMTDGILRRFEVYFPPLSTWFEVSAHPSEEGLAVYFRDVTDQHLSEEQLRESEARFKAVARATVDGVWDWDLKEGTIWWNDGFERLTGYSRDKADVRPDNWTSFIHPDDRDRVVSKIHGALERRDEQWEDQYRFLRSDGSEIEVEERGCLILDDRGEPVRFVGGMTDITERKRAERQIAEQAALIDAARDAIIARDMNHRIEFWSRGAEEIYGWTRDEAVGQSIEALLYDDPAPFRQAAAALLDRGEWRGTLQQRRKDGKPLTVAAHWTLVRDATGAPQRILAINTDITERLILEEQLRQAQRLEAVGQLTGGVAHDFNNLLTVILGNAELLVEDLNQNQRARFLAETMKTAAERGADLTARLLAFARRQPLHPRRVDLNRMMGSMDGLLRRTLGEQIEIRMVQAGGLWQALVDLPQIESALLNLCINARDAMPRGGKLTIETANVQLDADYAALNADVTPGQYVMLAVSDTGTGMTLEVIARAFEPFFTTKGAGKGSGLGLSMVYGFVKQSGGHVKIYSEIGHGTTIRLYLPRAPGDAEYQVTPERETTSEGGSEVILMVEDDDLVREHVAQQLRSLGYAVLTAPNAADALDVLHGDEAVELLFTDVVMPGGMNGRELADQARSIRPGLPVLFTSGYSENVIMHHGRLDPDVHLLQKPYGRHQLAAKLRQVLGERPRRP